MPVTGSGSGKCQTVLDAQIPSAPLILHHNHSLIAIDANEVTVQSSEHSLSCLKPAYTPKIFRVKTSHTFLKSAYNFSISTYRVFPQKKNKKKLCDSCWRWRRLPFIIYSTCAWPYICIYMFNRAGKGGGSNGQRVSIDKVISCSMPSRRSWTQRSLELELAWPRMVWLNYCAAFCCLSLHFSFRISLFILLPRNVSSMCSYELLIGHRVRWG